MKSALETFQKNTTSFLDALALIPDRMRNQAPENEWSAAYIVHQVADCELHFASRYLMMLGTDNPPMIYFDEEKYPKALHYESRTLGKSLASIVGIRTTVLEILTSIEGEAWLRQTTAEDGVVFTLEKLLEKANSHLSAHTEQLKALADSM